MKIGLLYRAYEDCVAILHAFCETKFDLENASTTFTFFYKDDEYIFSKDEEIIAKCDYKIQLFHTFNEWKDFKGFDKLIQTQIVENYHITNEELLEYLDAGNVAISSASISFEHPNFFYDPIINLIFFYYHYGYNFLNYYKFDKKENLLGIYHRPTNGLNLNKNHRNHLYDEIKNVMGDDFVSYKSNEYNQKVLFQSYITFGHWGNTHISSYIDFTTSVCNVVFETLYATANVEGPATGNKMYGRQYITEKTLKAICFSEENIFFIWYGPTNLYKHLMGIGFWFLNSEFYDESLEIPYMDGLPSYSHIEQSLIDTSLYLKKLKEEYKTNEEVHSYLVKKYGYKLQKNVELFKTMLNSYDKKDLLLNLIKNGNRN